MLGTPPLSLYIHIPWCVRKCPYCDFNSHEGKGALPFDAYVDALVRDLEQDLPRVWGRVVHSIFFGGGTPSLMPPDAMNRLLQQVSARLQLAPGCEITMETNPGTAEHGRFEGYLDAGINRLSFGVQSFDDNVLQTLGRIHGADEARNAVRMAQDAGFTNINLDLMYALPAQTLEMALHDVDQAIALNPTHISHYQLTMEPNTVFYAKPPANLPDDDLAWDMQTQCQDVLAKHGYIHYETSAYAREGFHCQHNLNYWRFGDYLGIGAGAHGKITMGHSQTIERRWKHKHPRTYMETAGTPANLGGTETVTADRVAFEFMMNALRLHEGFTVQNFEGSTGLSIDAIAEPLQDGENKGFLQRTDTGYRPTPLGRQFTNDLMTLFL